MFKTTSEASIKEHLRWVFDDDLGDIENTTNDGIYASCYSFNLTLTSGFELNSECQEFNEWNEQWVAVSLRVAEVIVLVVSHCVLSFSL